MCLHIQLWLRSYFNIAKSAHLPFVVYQARESASLRETLKAEREAYSSELEQLRSSLQKLQTQLRENVIAAPLITEKKEEERRRAEERHAQEILHLKQVNIRMDC